MDIPYTIPHLGPLISELEKSQDSMNVHITNLRSWRKSFKAFWFFISPMMKCFVFHFFLIGEKIQSALSTALNSFFL